MKFKIKASILLITLMCKISTSQAVDFYVIGTRASAMGNAAVAASDAWSASNNQAGLGFIDQWSGALSYEQKFYTKELALRALSVQLPTKKTGTFGITAWQFGYQNYNETKIGLAYGKKLSPKLAAGVQLDYLSTFIADNYGSRNVFTIELGLMAKPLKNLTIGTHIFNPQRADLVAGGNEKIPTVFRFGALYQFSKKLQITSEVQKDTEQSLMFKTGVAYSPIQQLEIRIGLATNPSLLSFGFGYKVNNLSIEVSTSYHQTLGFSPQLGLVYQSSKR
ncbi:MAG: hypothetical protein RIQ89_2143 [Bacteroidota bacterium]|jgi:hypothetical protein